MTPSDEVRQSTIPLTHGRGAMPAVGFGTLIPDLAETKRATTTALEVGFRHLDCAERYRNEQAVGDALQEIFKAGTIQREDVFVTTKLWNSNHRPERVKPAFDASLRRLQIDYADCYLIHTPFAFRPGNEQDPRDENGIVLLAFAALGHSSTPNLLQDAIITAIAARVDLTPAQVALSWAVQRGTAFLTTSTKPQRIMENFEISSLPDDAMLEIRERITTNIRFNAVIDSGVPGFIPPVKSPEPSA